MHMDLSELFHGPNVGYVVDLLERAERDPAQVDAATRALLERLAPLVASPPGEAVRGVDVAKIVGAARLARSIREFGHLAAHLDPLGAPPPGDPALDPATHGLSQEDLDRLPATIVWPDGRFPGSLGDAVARLRRLYCGTAGYDWSHVHDYGERDWLRVAVEEERFLTPLPAEERRALLRRLTEVEVFEQYLHTRFLGQKRFSIEGTDALVPMLDVVVEDAVALGMREVIIGMAHRGRLNVLAHVLRKPYTRILAEFQHLAERDREEEVDTTSGDVKYHLGAMRTLDDAAGDGHSGLKLTLPNNPSHLEFVDPVAEGIARSAQDDRTHPGAPRQDVARALAVLIHGDASFPGEGVVAETLNLSRLPGYTTGGTIHIITNNQLGFTTPPEEGRSTLYASDLAKGFEIPVVHVNADDPEMCLAVIRLALAYRHRFHKDFLIDLVGYRRYGHNEGDEPSFTQPLLYERIEQHKTVRALYAETLARAGLVTQDESLRLVAEAQAVLADAQSALEHGQADIASDPLPDLPPVDPRPVSAEELRRWQEELVSVPAGFHLNPKLGRVLERRREALRQGSGIDWAQAEQLAMAAILRDGTPIRLAGQDTVRGTFSQRHMAFVDVEDGHRHIPLQALTDAKASFTVLDSPLSEAAALGFEYGYSVHAPETLVLWEAQFGDFANAAQVMIDQFLAAARAKWRERSSLVLLLPHGYEGQGPEHSSARLERYLQLAAEDNFVVANLTTAAQYFHLLRRQAANLLRHPRPLVLMTPKSLLRHPLATSTLDELTEGGFAPVLDDPEATRRDPRRVERVVLASGKVAVDCLARRSALDEGQDAVAIVRLEELYPFPTEAVRQVLSRYPAARSFVWLQEEPRNMGAWTYVEPLLTPILPGRAELRYVGRPPRASTAEGSSDAHLAEQARILGEALAIGHPARTDTRGGAHAD
jgi:2-oxoglutarate dehydrogenase E1 component